jgi:hypothetical protein
MYLAPLNYDRYFKKVFSDERIAQQFLEDFLGITIVSLEQLPEKHRMTDDASIVEFDFRCQLDDGSYVIIDMQQWYKPDIVERFYLYHALNSGLQLETLPKERFVLSRKTGKTRKIRDYKELAPVLTLIWLVDETLQFKYNYVAYAMAPELVIEFLQNEQLWYKSEIQELLRERERILELVSNQTKRLDFLSQNRLIFILQKNIVKQLQGERYERWFQFAERSRNQENVVEDFDEFRGDEIFEEMIRRLNKSELTEEDYEYIENEAEMWREVERLERGYYEDGLRDGRLGGIQEGRKEGREEGIQEGRKAMIETISQILTVRFNVESDYFEKELEQLSLDRLKSLSKMALTVELDEFEAVLKQI